MTTKTKQSKYATLTRILERELDKKQKIRVLAERNDIVKLRASCKCSATTSRDVLRRALDKSKKYQKIYRTKFFKNDKYVTIYTLENETIAVSDISAEAQNEISTEIETLASA